MNVVADPAHAPAGPNGIGLPTARSVIYDPTPAELQELTSRMPQARRTVFGSYNVQTRVVSRSKACTYLVTDDASITDDQTIDSAEGARIAGLQDAYIANREMV
ncbi:MAG: hypothetical protein ACREMG_14605, partial [Gemmatimonadales bacterium]